MAARRKVIENILVSVMVLVALAAIVSTNLIYLDESKKASKERKVIGDRQKDLDRDIEELNKTITLLSAKETSSKTRDIQIQNLLEETELKIDQHHNGVVKELRKIINSTSS